MGRLGRLTSDLAREPLAPLSDASRERVTALLAKSAHVDLEMPAR